MGFTHVMAPAAPRAMPQAGGYQAEAGNNPPSGSDFWAQDKNYFGNLAADCQARQLSLLLDIDIRDVPQTGLPEDVEVFGPVSDEPPDPRAVILPASRRSLRLEQPSASDAVLRYWTDRLREWAGNGVSGFCLLHLTNAPPSFWRRLIQSVKADYPSLQMLAWTPGCSAEQIAALADCGFDACFSSAAWWDFHAGWLAEEHERLLPLGSPIAFPDSPFEPVINRIDDFADNTTRRRAHQRALLLASASGCGMLVPMGFEYGLSGLVDPEKSSAADFEKAIENAPFDLSNDISQANVLLKNIELSLGSVSCSRMALIAADATVSVMLRYPADSRAPGSRALLIVANADLCNPHQLTLSRLGERAQGFFPASRLSPPGSDPLGAQAMASLAPGALHVYTMDRARPILSAARRGKREVEAAIRVPRIAIEAISPAVDGGKFPVKRIAGELIDVEADIFADGHEKLGASILWRFSDEAIWQEVPMKPLGNDRWRAVLPLTRIGRYLFAVEAWRDAFATYRDELFKKVKAGLDVSLELEEGRLLVASAAQHAKDKGLTDVADFLLDLAGLLKGALSKRPAKAPVDQSERIGRLLSEETTEAMRKADARSFAVRSEPVMAIDAERIAARFSSWYELFPRSQSGDPQRHGTFADVENRLLAIRDMGFDTLYFTPIHPIGKKNRKGRNNSLTPAANDPGSPYAIGSDEGGHDAIHPELGTIEDFRHLRDAAASHGLELALDFAIQCSPDHPWLKQHPEWFAWRPDGSLRYAENPPKKYEDIVNVDFYAEGAMPSLWIALRDAVLFWVKEGVRVFRVDNPHTKPLPFWQWMIADIRGRYPDTIFLSEAFTRPKVMYRLAKVGFSQSYTYFTWRHTKAEFTDYLTELTTTAARDHFRPHFFVNTPDINPVFLQQSGRPGFLIRAALATTLSGLWGMYSGFELCEATPVPGKEDYLDSEKYEIRAWDWERPGNIIREITLLNRIRSANPALQTHLGIRFMPSSSDSILYFIKATPHESNPERFGDNVILVAINLDPFAAHDTSLELPLWRFGLPDDGVVEADDLVNGNRLTLRGKMQQLRLDPFTQPYAIWRIQPQRMRP